MYVDIPKLKYFQEVTIMFSRLEYMLLLSRKYVLFISYEQVRKNFRNAFVYADLYSLVAVFLRVLRTTFLPCSL